MACWKSETDYSGATARDLHPLPLVAGCAVHPERRENHPSTEGKGETSKTAGTNYETHACPPVEGKPRKRGHDEYRNEPQRATEGHGEKGGKGIATKSAKNAEEKGNQAGLPAVAGKHEIHRKTGEPVSKNCETPTRKKRPKVIMENEHGGEGTRRSHKHTD